MDYKGSPLLLAHQQSLGKLRMRARHRQDTDEHVLHVLTCKYDEVHLMKYILVRRCHKISEQHSQC